MAKSEANWAGNMAERLDNIRLDNLEEIHGFDEHITTSLYENGLIEKMFEAIGVDQHIQYVHQRMSLGGKQAETCKNDVYALVNRAVELQDAGFTDDFLVQTMKDGELDTVYHNFIPETDVQEFMKVYMEQAHGSFKEVEVDVPVYAPIVLVSDVGATLEAVPTGETVTQTIKIQNYNSDLEPDALDDADEFSLKTYLKAAGYVLGFGLATFAFGAMEGCAGQQNYISPGDIPMIPDIQPLYINSPGSGPVVLAAPPTGNGSNITNPSLKKLVDHVRQMRKAYPLDNSSAVVPAADSNDWRTEDGYTFNTIFLYNRGRFGLARYNIVGFDSSIAGEKKDGSFASFDFGGAWDVSDIRKGFPIFDSGDIASAAGPVGTSQTGGRHMEEGSYNEFWLGFRAVDRSEVLPYFNARGHWTSQGSDTITYTKTHLDFFDLGPDGEDRDKDTYSTTLTTGRNSTNRVGGAAEISIPGKVNINKNDIDINFPFSFDYSFLNQVMEPFNTKGASARERDSEDVRTYSAGVSVSPSKDPKWRADVRQTWTNGHDGDNTELRATSLGGYFQVDGRDNGSLLVVPILTMVNHGEYIMSGAITYHHPVFGEMAPNEGYRAFLEAVERNHNDLMGEPLLRNHVIRPGITIFGNYGGHRNSDSLGFSVGWGNPDGWSFGLGANAERNSSYHSLGGFGGFTYSF